MQAINDIYSSLNATSMPLNALAGNPLARRIYRRLPPVINRLHNRRVIFL